jgi:hypothetical protein
MIINNSQRTVGDCSWLTASRRGWLVRHMARAEISWILFRFAGQDVAVPGDSLEPDDTLEAVTAAYRQVWQRVDAVAFAAPAGRAAARR